MPLDKIVDRILKESRTQADAILSQARREAESIMARGRQQADERKLAFIRSARQKLNADKERKIALARLEARKNSLQARSQLIEQVFSRALQALGDLKPDELRRLFRKLLDDFVPSQSCQIIVHAPDLDKYTLLLSSLWQTAFTEFCQMNPVKESIGGGIIIRTRIVEYDYTFRRLVEEKRNNFEHLVTQYLFPKQKPEPADQGAGEP